MWGGGHEHLASLVGVGPDFCVEKIYLGKIKVNILLISKYVFIRYTYATCCLKIIALKVKLKVSYIHQIVCTALPIQQQALYDRPVNIKFHTLQINILFDTMRREFVSLVQRFGLLMM